jgi:hypothetical protein
MKTVFMTRGDVCREWGVTRGDLEKAVAAGVLHRVVLPGRKYGKFLRVEVERVFGKLAKEGVCSGKGK